MTQDSSPRIGKWSVCGLLLLALMLNYMDRQTLSLTFTTIKGELKLNNEHYGRLEAGFGYAFALGGLCTGFLADRFSVRWMFPLVLLGWSLAGVATGWADVLGTWLAPYVAHWWPSLVNPDDPAECAFLGFWVCRVLLGLFEAGVWPCALVTTQRLLSPENRPLGNSVLQSGASLGAIITPLVVQVLVTSEMGSWRKPYVVVGLLGLAWIVPWLWLMRGMNLKPIPAPGKLPEPDATPGAVSVSVASAHRLTFVLQYLALAVVVISINLPWHFFRAWLPLLLQEFHKYEAKEVRYFTVAYYIATDMGCLGIGLLTKWLTRQGTELHRTRVLAFALCAGLTTLSTVAAYQPRSPFLLGLLLLIGAGSLGLYPIYYSLTQELSARHQGKVTGTLSLIAWAFTSQMQILFGEHVNETQSYSEGIYIIGLTPLVGLLAVLLLWRHVPKPGGDLARSA